MIGIIIVAALATVIALIWLVLLLSASREDWLAAGYGKMVSCLDQIKQLQRKDRENAKKLSNYQGAARSIMKLFYSDDSSKQQAKLQSDIQRLQSGNLGCVNVFELPGYVLQRRLSFLSRGEINKKIFALFVEYSGKKYADHRTKRLIAQMLSYPLIGLVPVLAIGLMLLSAGNAMIGLMLIIVGSAIVLFLAYVFYDDINNKVTKRRAMISRQFPNVVSKLALLVTSGMIMDRAWKETAYSQDGELYAEMRQTAEERENLVDPAVAYSNFIDRCSTKETTKLASAIIQNLSKGNSEIGTLLKDMAKEAWTERRNLAKRDAEAANSKLMIPTMMLLLAILVMIMVPILNSFSTGF